ncbi:hypothetical protein [Hymenobacter psoromatis]|uniref:hypothetical protein n=1 Tax=Hymenobacter psoromatis TaxID=1484116 RepID=UPI001CBB4C67|nr:hypothetical protein [Hymenobacter psoromatis]
MRFILRWQLYGLLVASLGLLVLFGTTSYPDLVGRLRRANYALTTSSIKLPCSPARYAALRVGLAVVAAGAGLALVGGVGRQPPARRPRGRAAWWAPLAGLSGPERVLAGSLLLAAAGVRLWYAWDYALNIDEIASYDYWVLLGPAHTASSYLLPNNHVLANLLAGAVHGLLPAAPPVVALRLVPTLLGLALLPWGYALLLRYVGFLPATVGWGLFCLSPLMVFYTVAGRGYCLLLAALLAGLAASLALLRPQGLRRFARQRAWAAFSLSAVVGLYAVPTHLYVLLGLGLALLIGFSRGRGRARRLKLLHLAVITAGIGLTAMVLYAPIGAVSGWNMLVANPYVRPMPGNTFWTGLGPFYLLGTASELLGQRAISAALFVAIASATPLVLRWGKLPEPARRLGWLLYGQLVLWLPLLLVQRAYVPARALLAVLLALLVLGGLAGQVVMNKLRAAWRPARRVAPGAGLVALALLLGAYGSYRLHRERPIMRWQAQRQQDYDRAYDWLRAHRWRRVWVLESAKAVALCWQHRVLSAGQPLLPLAVVEGDQQRLITPTGPAEYEVWLVAPPGAQPAVFQTAEVAILPVSTRPTPAPAAQSPPR